MRRGRRGYISASATSRSLRDLRAKLFSTLRHWFPHLHEIGARKARKFHRAAVAAAFAPGMLRPPSEKLGSRGAKIMDNAASGSLLLRAPAAAIGGGPDHARLRASPAHIAIIMDGNGRWATRRRLPRSAGHRAGAKAVNAVVEAAARRGIATLTLYAFSAANWGRPAPEVSGLFMLLRRHLLTETRRCVEQRIRINVIGRRDRLTPGLRQLIERSEEATAHCSGMSLRIAVDYSAQHSLLEACRRLQSEAGLDRARFVELLAEVDHAMAPAPEVDLLIRTGGERRLSDFLLWECAYAELLFVDCLWPDFGEATFAEALAAYGGRERRFGRISGGALASSRHG